MERYIGTKILTAKPMNRREYNDLRGWRLPSDENGDDEGYLVEYTPDATNKPNLTGFDGYVSWTPKAVFEGSYRRIDNLTFGVALASLRMGFKVARAGWNGKGMFLVLVPGSPDVEPREGTPYASLLVAPSGRVTINPHIDMKTATGEMQPGWLASQTDMLAEDWAIIE